MTFYKNSCNLDSKMKFEDSIKCKSEVRCSDRALPFSYLHINWGTE
ncbi:MAG: hypothetical protein AABY22_29075 [Nanoarchaeota archaeon]